MLLEPGSHGAGTVCIALRRTKAIMCAWSRDEALKPATPCPGSLFLPVPAVSVGGDPELCKALAPGLFSRVAAAEEPLPEQTQRWGITGGPQGGHSPRLPQPRKHCTTLVPRFYWQYLLKPSFGVGGLPFYILKGLKNQIYCFIIEGSECTFPVCTLCF